ncbi:hypothetical protein LXL04_004331 [Taraxacum kok-saghyz]
MLVKLFKHEGMDPWRLFIEKSRIRIFAKRHKFEGMVPKKLFDLRIRTYNPEKFSPIQTGTLPENLLAPKLNEFKLVQFLKDKGNSPENLDLMTPKWKRHSLLRLKSITAWSSKFDDKSSSFPLMLLKERFKCVNCEAHVSPNPKGIVSEIPLLEISRWNKKCLTREHWKEFLGVNRYKYSRDENLWISSDNDPTSWLFRADKSCNVSDVHPDKFFKKSGNMTTAEFLPRVNVSKLQRLPTYLGIPSNKFLESSSERSLLLVNRNNQWYIDEVRLLSPRSRVLIYEEELTNEEYGYMTCESSHPHKLNCDNLKQHSPNDLLWLGKPHSYQVFNSTSSIGSKGKRLQVGEVSKLRRNGSIKRGIGKVKEPIDFGMVPLRLLYPRLRYFNRVKEPMIVGMAP